MHNIPLKKKTLKNLSKLEDDMETKVHGKNPICLHSNEPLQHDTFKRSCFPKFVCNLGW